MSDRVTQRFSDRVNNYVKYRPGYPEAVIDFLRKDFALASSDTVVDIGAGTGISSEIFLKNGNRVIAIEPNAPMRNRGIELMAQYPLFEAFDGTAESTELRDRIADVIVAGQAFHWFDRDKARAEFIRILNDGGLVVLMWNERLADTEFERRYDQLIVDHSTDYVTVDHRNIDDDAISRFFYPSSCVLRIFDNQQVFDFEGLKGRLASSSYVPNEGQPGFDPMVDALRHLFDQYQENNTITIRYATKVYVGRLKVH